MPLLRAIRGGWWAGTFTLSVSISPALQVFLWCHFMARFFALQKSCVLNCRRAVDRFRARVSYDHDHGGGFPVSRNKTAGFADVTDVDVAVMLENADG